MSSTLPYPESAVVIFLDRTHHSKNTEKLLRQMGVPVEVHRKNFHDEMPDPEWIRICADKGWAIITGDKGIENDGLNRDAVIKCRARVFMMHDHRSKGQEQTAAIIAARRKIARIVETSVGPFYCPVQIAGDSHVGKPNFYQGGYSIDVEAVPEFAIPVDEEVSKQSVRRKTKTPRMTNPTLFPES